MGKVTKYHVSEGAKTSGELVRCFAEKFPCTLSGGEEGHLYFESPTQAAEWSGLNYAISSGESEPWMEKRFAELNDLSDKQNPFKNSQKRSKAPRTKEEILKDIDPSGKVGSEVARQELYDLAASESVHSPVTVDELHNLLKDNGGFTWSPSRGSRNAGFAVSPFPERSVAIEDFGSLSESEQIDALVDYTSNNFDLLDEEENYLGGWLDKKTGITYLDISIVTPNAQEAVEICKEKDQIAYFDFQTGGEVVISRDAKSGQ